MALLANVKLNAAIEAQHASFAPTSDARVRRIISEHPIFSQFLEYFMDEFNEKRCTTVLLLDASVPGEYHTSDAMASIRDILSVAVISRARARYIHQNISLGICYSSAFDFYPWMVSKDNKSLTALTPELRSFQTIDNFKGQTFPGIPRYVLSCGSVDKPLFDALLDRWVKIYGSKSPQRNDEKLMRSLNMAYHACQLPGGPETSIFDFGRTIALWVSALEILVHPGKGGRANQHRVQELLKKDIWLDSFCRALSRDLCEKIYENRNDFIHGNPMERDSLKVREILNFVRVSAPLYRMAVAAFLELKLKPIEDPDRDIETLSGEESQQLGIEIAERRKFQDHQKLYEAAIRAAYSSVGEAREL